jgi:hypothetical protein
MNEEDFMALLEKAICDETTGAERAELEAYLAANPDARRAYDEMVETCELLGRVGDLEPPGDLRNRIMDSVDAGIYQAGGSEARAGGPSGWMGFNALFRPRLKIALAFSVGIIIGLLAYSIMRDGGRSSGDVSRLYGTIAGGETGDLKIISSTAVASAVVTGRIVLLEAGDLLVVAPELSPGGDLDFIIEFDPDVVRFRGFTYPDGPGVTLMAEEGYVASHGSGEGRYIVSVADTGAQTDIDTGPASLDIKVIRAGRVVYQGELSLPTDR